MTDTSAACALRAGLAALLLSTSGVAMAQSVPIVKPGAPGQASKTLSAAEATKLAQASYTAEDVAFMQAMIVHHQQAVDMAKLVEDRTNTEELRTIAGRIEASQADEIAFMRTWLKERGEPVEDPMMKGHGEHMHHMMKGMASPEDLKALAAAKGTDFDRRFLTLMIAHHDGALTMVEELLDEDGTAADPVLFQFVGDVESEQKAEIGKMDKVLAGLSGDPRTGLAAGFDNAGEAILGLTKIATLAKPAGFFNPENPADLRPPVPPKKGKDEAKAEPKQEAPDAIPAPPGATPALPPVAASENPAREEEEDLTEFAERTPLLDFANTDMAFFGDVMVAGSYHGFNISSWARTACPPSRAASCAPAGRAMSRSSAISSS